MTYHSKVQIYIYIQQYIQNTIKRQKIRSDFLNYLDYWLLLTFWFLQIHIVHRSLVPLVVGIIVSFWSQLTYKVKTHVEEIVYYHINSVFYHCIFSFFWGNITSLIFNSKETTYALCTHYFSKTPNIFATGSRFNTRAPFEHCILYSGKPPPYVCLGTRFWLRFGTTLQFFQYTLEQHKRNFS